MLTTGQRLVWRVTLWVLVSSWTVGGKVLQCGYNENRCSEMFLPYVIEASPQAYRMTVKGKLNVATDCQQSPSPSLPSYRSVRLHCEKQ